MDNEVLKQIFNDLRETITRKVDPHTVIERMCNSKAISFDDYYILCNIEDSRHCWNELWSILDESSRPQNFVHLYDVIRNDYPEIVREIDQQLTPTQTAQPQHLIQQLHLGHNIDGQFVHSAHNFRWIVIY